MVLQSVRKSEVPIKIWILISSVTESVLFSQEACFDWKFSSLMLDVIGVGTGHSAEVGNSIKIGLSKLNYVSLGKITLAQSTGISPGDFSLDVCVEKITWWLLIEEYFGDMYSFYFIFKTASCGETLQSPN